MRRVLECVTFVTAAMATTVVAGCYKEEPGTAPPPAAPSVEDGLMETRGRQPPREAVDPAAPPSSAPAPALVAGGASSAAELRRLGAAIPEQIVERNSDSLLGGELGLDHVGVAVADLEAAARALTSLGFDNPQRGKLPNGIQNANFYFGDATYLELLNAYDASKAGDVARFVAANGQGAMFFVLAIFSARETATYLSKRGFTAGEPIPGRIESAGVAADPQPMWHTMFVTSPRFPGAPFFFIAYDRAIRNLTLKGIKDEALRRRAFSHRNGALGVKSVWLAVRDLDKARRLYSDLGLTAGTPIRLAPLRASGIVMSAGQGTLLLLRPDDSDGPAARFLAARGEDGIIGIGVAVEKIGWARGLIQHQLGTTLPSYDGVQGPAVLVRPELAGGVWLELFTPAAPRRNE